jgi:hypothetical protein
VDSPADQIVASEVFSSDERALAAVSAVYANCVNGTGQHTVNRLLTVYGGYASDELSHFSPNTNARAFLENSLQSSNSIARLMWNSSYETIYHANVCIEGLTSSSLVSTELKSRLISEMKFVRAWQHFLLYQLYGQVPLVTTTDFKTNSLLSRSDSLSLFNQICMDVEEAAEALPEEFENGERIRPTKWAALALMERIYLYQQRWRDAEVVATKILASDNFSPLPGTQQVFLKNSKEAIWHLMPIAGRLPITLDLLATSVPRVILTSELVQKLDRNDSRWLWVDSVYRSGRYYYYPKKYRNTSTDITEYFMLFRVADIWLIRSEARAMQEDWIGSVDDLNKIRQRAGVEIIPNISDPATLLNLIWEERFRELWAEHADRWLTLKRTDRVHAVLKPIKPNLRPEDILFPIPFSEILFNPNITQNPGY